MTAALPAPAVAGLLRAISARLTPPDPPLDATGHLLELRSASSDVRLAIAAILGNGLDPIDMAAFTCLLDPRLPEAPPGPEPAAGHCPVCLVVLAEDGSHISALSGAHIPAVPAEVTS